MNLRLSFNYTDSRFFVLTLLLKVTVQFETEGSGQNEIFIHMDRSEISKKNFVIPHYTQRDFETEKLHQE